jgi:tRNA A-37 threonylcarbamoyl transferase component Bud32
MQIINTSTILLSGRQLDFPASVRVRVGGREGAAPQTLELLELLRVLPRKRVVALARWQGALVVAKLFFKRGRWEQHLQRDVQGVAALEEAGIKTAGLVANGELVDGQCGFLLMRYIENGEGLGPRWERADTQERLELLHKVVSLIADCHERGILQQDIHLDNFLLQGAAVYLIDAGNLERYPQNVDGVDGVNSLRNLAVFLAQFPVSNDALAPSLYEYYRQQRPSADLSEDIAVFAALLRKKRTIRLKLVLKKLYRETSANGYRRDWNHYIVYDRCLESPALQTFLVAPDGFIDRGEIIKAGTTTTVALIEIDGVQYVLKRYNIKDLWHRIRRLFRPSRAWLCWRNAHMLKMLGVRTANPLLMMERRFGPLRREAYFLSEYLPGEDALRVLNNEPFDAPVWQRTLSQFKDLLATFRDYSIVHGDMKATNFQITGQDVAVLDLDGMYQESDTRRFARAREKDLQRFAKNWKDDPARAQKVQTMLVQLQDESDYFTKGS